MTSHAATKLARLNERFQSFYGDLEQEKTHRRALESDRMNAIEGRLDAIERDVQRAGEAGRKARMESAARLEKLVRETEATLSAARAAAVEERLSASVSALTTAIESVHEALNAEKEQRATEMETVTTSLSRRVEDFGAALDDERLARLEREAEVIARVGQDVNELQTKMEAERNTRESAVGKLAMVVEEVRHQSVAGEGDFHAVVLEELGALKLGLQKERAERMEEDELIVQAVGEYSKTIQNGLRIANQ